MDVTPILDGLNAPQRSAVVSPASVLQILAPPGSGKTKTLTSRVAYLLSYHGYKPSDILCLTFTKKSAREMKSRIAKLIGNGLESKLVLGTFHSVCHRYLKTYGYLIGLRKGFNIADSSDSIAIITRIIKRLKLTIDPKAARSRISSSKARSIGYEQLLAEAEQKKKVDQQDFVSVFRAYQAELTTSNLLDYDDLLLRCAELLQDHPTCVSNVEVVLIDEFQDTNLVQFDLMRLFATKNHRVTTVGDPDQSIYGWRSAEIKNLKRMQKLFPETLVIHLEDNYRSSGAILLAALEVIEQDESRPAKPLRPTHCPGTVPVLRRLPSAAIEASWIVSEIRRLMALSGDLLTYDDFAILLRSASLSRQIESAMGKAGIPYRMVGGLRFFDRIEIKVLLDYLRVISQPDNSDALARIINIPSRRIGDVTTKALLEEAASKNSTLWGLVKEIVQGYVVPKTKISKSVEQGLSNVINIILTARSKVLDLEHPCLPQQLLKHILKKLDFREYLKKTHVEDHEVRWANVDELIAQASDCSIPPASSPSEEDEDSLPQIGGLQQETGTSGEETLSKFLANVALSTELQREEDVDEKAGSQSRITISTIHAAKGLEWPVVFIPSTYEGSIPHSRAEDGDEERRLLYVAMTRAQALLYMSCPTKNSMREETKLSSFLSPKKVASYLTNKGPSLKLDVVQDISRILRRDCPSEEETIRGINKVDSTEDDLWPLNGEEDPEVVAARWDSHGITNDGRDSKRRKHIAGGSGDWRAQHSSLMQTSSTNSNSSNVRITMQESSLFTITPHISGFVSATTQLQNTRQDTQTNAISPARLEEHEKRSEMGKGGRKKKLSRNQGSLMTYWGGKTDDSKETVSGTIQSVPNVIRGCSIERNPGTTRENTTRRSEARASADITPPLPPSTSNFAPGIGTRRRRPMSDIPQSRSNHVTRPLVNISRSGQSPIDEFYNSNAYVFLSSSPPQENETDVAQTVSSESLCHGPGAASVATSAQVSKVMSDIRPSSTYHQTSMAQVQARSIGPRKTLGVRRSMVGWNARGSHSSSKPRTSD